MHTVVSGDPRFLWCYLEDQKQYDGHHTASSRHPLNFLIGNWFVATYVFHNANYFQFVLYLLIYEDRAFCRRNDLAAVHQDEAWKDKLPIRGVHSNLAKEYLFGPVMKREKLTSWFITSWGTRKYTFLAHHCSKCSYCIYNNQK